MGVSQKDKASAFKAVKHYIKLNCETSCSTESHCARKMNADKVEEGASWEMVLPCWKNLSEAPAELH